MEDSLFCAACEFYPCICEYCEEEKKEDVSEEPASEEPDEEPEESASEEASEEPAMRSPTKLIRVKSIEDLLCSACECHPCVCIDESNRTPAFYYTIVKGRSGEERDEMVFYPGEVLIAGPGHDEVFTMVGIEELASEELPEEPAGADAERPYLVMRSGGGRTTDIFQWRTRPTPIENDVNGAEEPSEITYWRTWRNSSMLDRSYQ